MERNKEIAENIQEDNRKVFALLSNYLNLEPDLVKPEEIDEIVKYGVSHEYAFAAILAAAFGLDIADKPEDKGLFNNYFSQMIHKLEPDEYYNNAYYQNIRFPSIAMGSCELKYEKYKPYEGFVCNDIIRTGEGRQLPQIGFFAAEFRFPAILEGGRIWMTVTPNEIETMKDAVDGAFGNVLTFGLGLGYYAYMISEKTSVERITIVEVNTDVIHLFNQHLLPQFQNAGKVRIVQADAFEYAQKHITPGAYDFVFTDLWHDVSDGMDMYLKMKQYEPQSPATEFMYWIEQSILCYL